ncbi:MAG: hypothetical protein LUG98_15595, partial [Tannerellaceae bacterium]|nr:hypothetical protein [Tannerellaceae bacterium]
MKTKRNKKPDHPYTSYKKGEKPKKEKRKKPGGKEKSWSILSETDGTFTTRQDIFTKINDEELIIRKPKTLFNYVLFLLQICLIVTMIGFFVYFIYKAINDFSFGYLVLILLLLYPVMLTVLDTIGDYMNLASHD